MATGSKKFWYEPLIDNGYLPDFLMRVAIRMILKGRAKELNNLVVAANYGQKVSYIDSLRQRLIAEEPDAANKQHYEVSTEFMQMSLGKRMKYSACLFPTGTETLDEAEERMLETYCEKAQINDGLEILDLGCGWGSLCLFLCEKYPKASITALSNSATQRKYIEGIAKDKGFNNLRVITANVDNFNFQDEKKFDRVISIEMFEHMKNYQTLLKKIAGWLKPDGYLFIHTFCHKSMPYDFEGDDSWMTKYFFTGGTMPSIDLFLYFQQDLIIENQWVYNGKHYAQTSEEWLKLMDNNKSDAIPYLVETYGAENANSWFNRWRVFYITVAEFFGYNDGNEWCVVHYLFKKRA
ncbi:hypothetical protein G9A89_002295 [Geosiphon pyriformis]|nr:hypothetical protein G9A89_002295 [Geosiphon pyriformis]